jgi:hypothetical protein
MLLPDHDAAGRIQRMRVEARLEEIEARNLLEQARQQEIELQAGFSEPLPRHLARRLAAGLGKLLGTMPGGYIRPEGEGHSPLSLAAGRQK